jgi:hypothetical protein
MQEQTAMVCNDSSHAPFWPTEDGKDCTECRTVEQEQVDEINNAFPLQTPGFDSSLSASSSSSSLSVSPSAPSPSANTSELQLHETYIHLSHLGRQEGHFVLEAAKNAIQSVSFILDTFAEDNVTRSVFITAYTSTGCRASTQARSMVWSCVCSGWTGYGIAWSSGVGKKELEEIDSC